MPRQDSEIINYTKGVNLFGKDFETLMNGRSLFCFLICIVGILANCMADARSQLSQDTNQGLIGFWKLQGDCNDYSGNNNHGIKHGVIFEKTDSGLLARFEGKGGYIEVPNSDSLNPGTKDFSISALVKCDHGVLGVPGDIISKYDEYARNGINLSISASSPGYSSVSDSRNIQFGIDNATDGNWVDCGRPWPSNTLISTLIVYKGQLYTGIADAADPNDACHMFRYAGDKKWIDCGRVGSDNKTLSVYSVIVHKGQLYAGTGVWDWEKAWSGNAGPTHVYRYEGGTKWHDCGQFGNGYRVLSLASFKGNLYAADDKGSQYRYDGDNNWKLCGELNKGSQKIYSMMVYQGELYGGANITAHRFDGATTWNTIGVFDVNVINQIHTLNVYQGKLYAGTWPEGKVVMYEGDNHWADCGNMGIDTVHQKINELNELTVYNGKLYAGVIPKGEVWRYDGGKQWTLVKQLVQNPEWASTKLFSWNRVPCMTVFQGKLFAGTSTCAGRAEVEQKTDVGKVFSWEAGKNVSYDDDIGTGWNHIVAVKEGNKLKLFLNSNLVGTSSDFDASQFKLSNNKSLLIGFGNKNYFAGFMKDIRIYNRALDQVEVKVLCGKI